MQALAPSTDSDSCAPAPSPLFTDVYREYFAFVWRNARGLGTRPAALEDVVQEIFVVVHRRLPEFEGRSSVRTWLSRIVLNVVRHHRRSLSRKSPHERSDEESRDPEGLPTRGRDPYELAALSEGTRLVQRILDSLDDEKREVLVLAEFEDLAVPEIAEALGLNLNTAYSRLRLARKAFDEALARHRAQEGERRR
jgi:RNA polymerase sigma-70 factor, ECF subfamily